MKVTSERLKEVLTCLAKIQVDGKSVYLGLHSTKELAHAAYREGAVRHHGDFARFE